MVLAEGTWLKYFALGMYIYVSEISLSYLHSACVCVLPRVRERKRGARTCYPGNNRGVNHKLVCYYFFASECECVCINGLIVFHSAAYIVFIGAF